MTSAEIVLVLTNSYQFATTGNETSSLISQYVSCISSSSGTSSSTTYKYTYDENGNITEIRKPNTVTYLKSNCTCPGVGQCDDECADGCPCVYQLCGCRKTILQCRYVYDVKGQLIREDNLPMNLTYVYTYDDAGNILSQTWYTFSVNVATEDLTNPTMNRVYAYEAGTDRLISYKGQPIVYDEIGNPTSYRGKIMTWQKGRQLASYRNGSVTYGFEYNADGIRTNKTGGGVTTEYVLNGSQVMRQIINDGTTTYVADYLYHENGTPMAFAYYPLGGTPVYYFYETNLQGDIVAIYDSNGAKVVGFRYNAWGTFNTDKANTTVCTDLFLRASLFRYRSYIYDYETNFYYLQSRYYDPEVGRFINADNQISGVGGAMLGNNMYAYCMNDPINMTDAYGDWPQWVTIAVGAVAAAAAITLTVATFGAAAPAAACTLTMVGMSLGVGYTVASTAATVAVVATTVAASAYAGDIAYSMVTGESILLNTVFRGNTEAYNTGLLLTSFATAGMFEAAAQSPGVCFIAGTPVITVEGQVAIEQIKAGDKVWAKNPDTGEIALKSVVQTFVNETDELVHVFANGEEIVTTPEHPFYVANKGWISAIQLRAGDILVSLNGSLVVLEKIQHEILEAPITVYNFEVEDFHTYFVGDDGGILVHNTCNNPGGRHGGTTHRNKIDGVKKQLRQMGWNYTDSEQRVTINQKGNYRYPDIIATKPNYTCYIQVGKRNLNGLPIAREQRALSDLRGTGVITIFIPYN